MYNVYGFGKRIASCRKMMGFTQEELAVKLNITAQAVSKWENELSFPEITILPQLACTLNTTIEKLFGNEKDSGKIAFKDQYVNSFPENKGSNLRLAHVVSDVACYSEKEVEITNDDSVYFKDGSSADLKQLRIVNKGVGDIYFDFADNIPRQFTASDLNKTEINEVYTYIDSIEMYANNSNYKLIKSNDNRTHVKAIGSAMFIAGLKLTQTEGMLSIKDENENNRSGNNNKVIIYFGKDYGKNARASINGSGDISIDLPFENGFGFINGSGQLIFSDLNKFDGKINGSGNIICGKVGNSQISINGSGDFEAKEIFGSFKSKINGSGDINLKSGKLDYFEAMIAGSGDIHAKDISTRASNMSIEGSGEITVGRVMEESIEKHSKNSLIKVLARGTPET